jgi:hypothetical protein
MFEDRQGDELSRRVNLKAKSKRLQLLAGLAFVGFVARATLKDSVFGPKRMSGKRCQNAKPKETNSKELESLGSTLHEATRSADRCLQTHHWQGEGCLL